MAHNTRKRTSQNSGCQKKKFKIVWEKFQHRAGSIWSKLDLTLVWKNVRDWPKVRPRFGRTFFFVGKFCLYSLSESSAEVRPNRKFGLSLLTKYMFYDHSQSWSAKAGKIWSTITHNHDRWNWVKKYLRSLMIVIWSEMISDHDPISPTLCWVSIKKITLASFGSIILNPLLSVRLFSDM